MEDKTIYKKLADSKNEFGALVKDSTNPFFKSKYLSLNALLSTIEPVLYLNGLVLLQPIEDGKVITKIICTDSGQGIESSIELPNIPDPQKLGSAVTYFRRYSLQSLLGLQAEDDDANVATKAQDEKKEEPKDDKIWLNKYNKDKSKVLEFYTKVVTNAKVKNMTVKDLREYYKINKEVAVELENDLK